MPDVHPGTLSTIGFTSTLGSTVLPNVIGIDIGCGVTMAQITGRINEYEKLDKVIRESVPSGFNIHKSPLSKADEIDLSKLSCFQHINASVAYRSLGTLGGGNHFIEVGKDESKNAYLTVHSGSRHLGKEVTEYFLKQGQKQLKEKENRCMKQCIRRLENILRQSRIHLARLQEQIIRISRWEIRTKTMRIRDI